jgi:hypothetical protein
VQIPFFVQYKNINTGVDFNFRAGAKYFLPVNYEINATPIMQMVLLIILMST